MLKMCESILKIYSDYSNGSAYMLIVLAALTYLWLTEKNKSIRSIILYTVSSFFILFFIPFYAYIVVHFLLEESIYYRSLWFVPTAIIVAYAGVRVVIGMKSISRRIISGVMLFAIIAMGGSCVFTDKIYEKAENWYHVPQEVVEITELLSSDDVTIKAAVPAELVQFIRQVDPDIVLCYGRESLVESWGSVSPLYTAIQAPQLDAWTIQSEARRVECNCIVIDNTKAMTGDLRNELFSYYATVGKFDIYLDEVVYQSYFE